jgi:hypothetical protein
VMEAHVGGDRGLNGAGQPLCNRNEGPMTKAEKMSPSSNNSDDSATSLYARVDCFRQL